jgi:hypothetical protein
MMQSLCEKCRLMREIVTSRGSRFLLCQLSMSNAAYPKYPRQPIVHCDGYQSKDLSKTLPHKTPSGDGTAPGK